MVKLVRALARLLLAIYPASVRGEIRARFLEAAEHRWARERQRADPVSALVRTARVLLADTLRAAPREWSARLGGVRSVRDDLVWALRQLVRTPGFTVVALLTLVLTIGANAAILSVADAVLFRPLAYGEVDRLRVVEMHDERTGARYTMVRHAYLEAIRDAGDRIGAVAFLDETAPLRVSSPAGAEAIATAEASAGYFEVLGVRAWRGRLLGSADAAAGGRPAVLSHAAWWQRFGADETVVGGTVTLGPSRFDVVGVLPPGFVFPSPTVGEPEIVTVAAAPARGAQGGTFHPVVRLAPGVSDGAAQRELDRVAAPLARPGLVEGRTRPRLAPVRPVLFATGGPIVRLLLAASGLVLLLGCANLANLLRVRARRREAETGVRAALGADTARIVRPILFEAVLLAMVGGALAVGVTALGFQSLLRHVPPVAFGAADVGVDGRVALATLGAGVLAGLAFSVAPAWASTRVDVQGLLRSGGDRGGTGRALLGPGAVALQVGAAVVLAYGAAVTGRAFVDVLRVPLGFDPEGVALLSARAPEGLHGAEAQAFYRDVVQALAARADVDAVGAGPVPLVSPGGFAALERAPGGGMVATAVHALPGYFEAAGIALLRGRALTWDDVAADAPVAVLSSAGALALLPGVDPLDATFVDHRGRTVRVVGVAADVRRRATGEVEPPVYLVPGRETRSLTVLARAREPNAATLEELRATVAGLAPERVVTARWWDEAVDALTAYRNPRFQSLVLMSFAALALLLTGLGVYGVVANLVASRRRELGIRMALGCTAHGLVRMVVRQSLAPVLAGLVVGLAATRLLAGLAEAQLYEVDASDPLTLALASAVVLSSAMAAAVLPARRASGVGLEIVRRGE